MRIFPGFPRAETSHLSFYNNIALRQDVNRPSPLAGRGRYSSLTFGSLKNFPTCRQNILRKIRLPNIRETGRTQ
jgi:hypothetical protein